jgi:hypothetical protein
LPQRRQRFLNQDKAAGEVLTAKQAPHRPGIAPALGLRAGRDDLSSYRRLALERRDFMLFTSWLRHWNRSAPAAGRRTQTSLRPRASFRPRVEALEARDVPSTLTVTNTNDSGPGSLRAEIATAQRGDTIVFSPTLFSTTSSKPHHGGTTSTPATIALTSGELDLTKNLTIQGPGAGELTISGYHAASGHGGVSTDFRVFEVAPDTTVTLSGLTVSSGNGWAGLGSIDTGYGGDILNHGTLMVSGCKVSGGFCEVGGGIYSDGTLTVSGSTISGNSADAAGGGICNDGTATLISSTVSNNRSWYVDGGYLTHGEGGGIFNHGTLTLSGSTISGNFAGYEGGGIYNDGTVTVKNASSITANTLVSVAQDVDNLGVLYLDSTSVIDYLDGNPPILI